MAFITLEDYLGEIEVLLFPKAYAPIAPLLGVDRAIAVQGSISSEEDRTKLIGQAVRLLIANSEKTPVSLKTPVAESSEKSKAPSAPPIAPKGASPLLAKQIFIRLPSFGCEAYRRVVAMTEIFFEEGNAEVIFYNAEDGKYTRLSGRKMRTSSLVVDTLKQICGETNIILRM